MLKLTGAALFIGAVAFLAVQQNAAPELILFNGKIFTSNAAQPSAEALAIRGERIVAVDSSAKIKALAGAQTKLIDLGGRTVIPGINDAHNHIDLRPVNQVDVELRVLIRRGRGEGCGDGGGGKIAEQIFAACDDRAERVWRCDGEPGCAGSAGAEKSGSAGDDHRHGFI